MQISWKISGNFQKSKKTQKKVTLFLFEIPEGLFRGFRSVAICFLWNFWPENPRFPEISGNFSPRGIFGKFSGTFLDKFPGFWTFLLGNEGFFRKKSAKKCPNLSQICQFSEKKHVFFHVSYSKVTSPPIYIAWKSPLRTLTGRKSKVAKKIAFFSPKFGGKFRKKKTP